MSHFPLQLFDVLQHRLQGLMGVGHLRVIFGHVMLPQLLSLEMRQHLKTERNLGIFSTDVLHLK